MNAINVKTVSILFLALALSVVSIVAFVFPRGADASVTIPGTNTIGRARTSFTFPRLAINQSNTTSTLASETNSSEASTGGNVGSGEEEEEGVPVTTVAPLAVTAPGGGNNNGGATSGNGGNGADGGTPGLVHSGDVSSNANTLNSVNRTTTIIFFRAPR